MNGSPYILCILVLCIVVGCLRCSSDGKLVSSVSIFVCDTLESKYPFIIPDNL